MDGAARSGCCARKLEERSGGAAPYFPTIRERNSEKREGRPHLAARDVREAAKDEGCRDKFPGDRNREFGSREQGMQKTVTEKAGADQRRSLTRGLLGFLRKPLCAFNVRPLQAGTLKPGPFEIRFIEPSAAKIGIRKIGVG
jgi:hypothetical protein